MTIDVVDPTEYYLSRDRLKALRNADSVSFHHHAPGTRRTLMPSFINAHKTIDRGDGFGGTETIVTIPTMETVFTVYRDPHYDDRRRVQNAFASITAAKFHAEWVTVAKMLRVNDRLKLRWQVNAHAPVVGEAGLVTDIASLLVYRGPLDKPTVLTFHIDTMTTTRHSLARNVTFA